MKKLFLAIIILGAAVGGYFVINLDFEALFQPDPITEQEARAIIAQQINGNIQQISYINSDTPYYKATVQQHNETVTIEVDAISKRLSALPNQEPEKHALPLTKESATQLAKQQFDGDITNITLVQQNDQTLYEIELESNTQRATLSFDQQTGELIKNEITDRETTGRNIDSVASALSNKSKNDAQQTEVTKPSINNTTAPTSTTITLEDAKKIASQKIQGDIKSAKLNDQNEYQITIQQGQDKYTFKIHSKTGAIIQTKKN